MRLVVIDYETYFADDYTLSKMSTEAYIRDPRFQAHGAAIKWGADIAARWYDEQQLRWVLAQEDWSDTAIVAWHAQFDGLILSHHYDVHPKLLICPMAMFRMLHGTWRSAALDKVRGYFGMPPKTTPYNLFRGLHWSNMSSDTRRQVADGCADEVESIWQLFCRFAKDFPAEEFEVMDETLKMFTTPVLRADRPLLRQIWEGEERAKSARAATLGVDPSELQSAERFAALLEAEGVEIEYKAGKNGSIPAFAKTDDFMRDLLDDADDRVRALAEARLGEKSTIMQTRAATLGWMASRGPLCVYLNYSGAGTLRPSGGDKTNFLNMKRKSPIRRALLAPEGYWLAPIDAAQIECRVLHYLAGGPDEPVLQKFRNHEDPYSDIATKFYGEPIYKPGADDPRKDEMEAKRGMGKQGRLMCGYGAGAKQFKKTAKNGLYGPPVDMSIEDATEFVRLYRQDTPSVCAPRTGYWAQANRMIARLAGGEPLQWGPLLVKDHRLYLPNGCCVVYDTLEHHVPEEGEPCRDHERGGYWRVRTRQGWKTMWGSKLVQNVCEAVSRVIVTQAMVRIRRMGIRTLNYPYDELLLLIPKGPDAERTLAACKAEMTREVAWLPGLPLDCDGELGDRYEK